MSLFHGEADGGIPSSGLSSDLAGSTGFSSAGKLLQPCWSLPAQNVNFVIKNLWFRSLFTLHSSLFTLNYKFTRRLHGQFPLCGVTLINRCGVCSGDMTPPGTESLCHPICSPHLILTLLLHFNTSLIFQHFYHTYTLFIS